MAFKSVSLTVLVENTVTREEFKAEHGLSVWVETPGGKILWDTGQSELLLENAQKMGVGLESAACVALSHGHYDHTGGLSAVLNLLPGARVCGHPEVFRQRYGCSRKSGNDVRSIGSPVVREKVESKGAVLELSAGPSEILPGIFLTGEIPRLTRYEDTGGDFFTDLECTVPDLIPDDQALYFDTREGIVVLLGCAHSGVINTLRHVSTLTGRDRIYGVIGGTHLITASEERLSETASALVSFDVRMMSPCHCTGERAKAFFRTSFPERTVECFTGKRFSFDI